MAGSLQRLNGAGFVDMDDGVELLRQARFEVVAQALGFRQVNDSDRAFQSLAGECLLQPAICAGEQHKFPHIRFVKKTLPATQQRRTHAFAFGRAAPIAGRSHSPGISREADKKRFVAIPLTH